MEETTSEKIKEIASRMGVMKKALTLIKTAESAYSNKLSSHINTVVRFGKKKVVKELAE